MHPDGGMNSSLRTITLVNCAGAVRVAWSPGDEAARHLAIFVEAGVVKNDGDRGVTFPHRLIRDYFGALGALDAAAAALEHGGSFWDAGDFSESLAVDDGNNACDAFKRWAESRLGAPPRDAVLAVLLSAGTSSDLKSWALSSPAWEDWNDRREELERVTLVVPQPSELPAMPPRLARAAANAANGSMCHVALALCTQHPCTCTFIAAAAASGCTISRFTDLLGDCIQSCACAASFWFRESFSNAAAAFWDSAPSAIAADRLGVAFWAVADAVTGGEQASRAISLLRAATAAGDHLAVDIVDRASAASVVLASIAHFTTPEALAEARRVLEQASKAKEPLYTEASLALAILDPPVASAASASAPIRGAPSLKQRLLQLATSPSSSASIVSRTAKELATRFPDDADVRSALKTAAGRRGKSRFVDACVTGPGLPLVTMEIALELFRRLSPPERIRLALRMWDPSADADAAVAEAVTPLHVAAARARANFVFAFLAECNGECGVVNKASKGGSTPLDHASSVYCIAALLEVGATCGVPRPSCRTSLHVAAGSGSTPLVRRLLDAGAHVNAADEVGCVRMPVR